MVYYYESSGLCDLIILIDKSSDCKQLAVAYTADDDSGTLIGCMYHLAIAYV